jgi:phosphoserine aminotransferase
LSNFSPGPAPLPSAVMREIQAEMLNYRGTGMSVMCMSHRSPEFGVVLQETLATARRVLEVPATHEILFTHGGGHGQFAAVPLNLCGGGKDCVADYVLTGSWSRRAAAEASKYVTVRTAAESDGTRLPPQSEWALDARASYRYLCSNETVEGTEFRSLPAFADGVPLVVDMSSDLASKPVDWSRCAVAFACAPKNIGHAGLTIVVVRSDLLADRLAQAACPGVLSWRSNLESGGMWNTPPTFNIYTTGKVLGWIEGGGGVRAAHERALRKAGALYDAIDQSGGFYGSPVAVHSHRSLMNVPFNVCGGERAATEAFLIGAYERNMVGFRTNTPWGFGAWLRASLYTGTTPTEAEELAEYMRSFAKSWRRDAPSSARGSPEMCPAP